jgi:cardiolipin synthase
VNRVNASAGERQSRNIKAPPAGREPLTEAARNGLVRIMEQAVPRTQPLSLPNLLTYARLAAVPLIAMVMFFMEGETRDWLAVGIFVFASITDFLDGYVARAWGQQSLLGRMLDPIADKLLVGATLLMLVSQQTISGWSIWAAITILSREILVSGLREYLAELNVKVAVSRLAKWKTSAQMVALCFLLAGEAGNAAVGYTTDLGLVLLWMAALLTIYTGFDYFRAGLKHVISEQ